MLTQSAIGGRPERPDDRRMAAPTRPDGGIGASAVGLAILWLTGPLLVITKWEGGFAALPALFDVKMVFAVLLTLAVGAIHWVYGEIRKGRRERASLLPRLGPAAGIASLLTVLFAVLAFS